EGEEEQGGERHQAVGADEMAEAAAQRGTGRAQRGHPGAPVRGVMAEAARVSAAGVRPAPLNSARTLPPTNTRALRHTVATSSKSLETSSTARPRSSASWSRR